MGGLPYPELSDWHPKGQVSQAYDVWNEERGASQRAVLVVDKQGVIRYRETPPPEYCPTRRKSWRPWKAWNKGAGQPFLKEKPPALIWADGLFCHFRH